MFNDILKNHPCSQDADFEVIDVSFHEGQVLMVLRLF